MLGFREFFRVIQTRLVELERSKIVAVGSSRRSLLESCGGDRFLELVLVLSSHALRCTILREHPRRFPCEEAVLAIPINRDGASRCPIPPKLLRAKILSEAMRFSTNIAAAKTMREKRERKIMELGETLKSLTRACQQQVRAAHKGADSDVDRTLAKSTLQSSQVINYRETTRRRRIAVDTILREEDGNLRVTVDHGVVGSFCDLGMLFRRRAKTLAALISAVHGGSANHPTKESIETTIKAHRGCIGALREMNSRILEMRENIQMRTNKLKTQLSPVQMRMDGFLPASIANFSVGSEPEEYGMEETAFSYVDIDSKVPSSKEPIERTLSDAKTHKFERKLATGTPCDERSNSQHSSRSRKSLDRDSSNENKENETQKSSVAKRGEGCSRYTSAGGGRKGA